MSAWHEARQARYNRDAQIAELYDEETEADGPFPFDPILTADGPRWPRGMQPFHPLPGLRDRWQSDRYNKPL